MYDPVADLFSQLFHTFDFTLIRGNGGIMQLNVTLEELDLKSDVIFA